MLLWLIAAWAAQVLDGLWMCPATMGPTLGANFCHRFSSPKLARRAQVLGPWD